MYPDLRASDAGIREVILNSDRWEIFALKLTAHSKCITSEPHIPDVSYSQPW